MTTGTSNPQSNIASSQDFVPIKEVKDGVVVLDDGTLVSISLVTSVNISLKSYEEQEVTINAFKAFLNVLEFPVQISIQSRRLDIKPYLEILEERLKNQTNEILKLQTIEYIAFIKNFTDAINIMDKKFFLVVSYRPVVFSAASNGVFGKIPFFGNKSSNNQKNATNDRIIFEEAKAQLEQRTGLLSSALSRTGVKIKTLDTESVLEVFYSIFNPDQGGVQGVVGTPNKHK